MSRSASAVIRPATLTLALLILSCAAAYAQKTDVVTLVNGDRMTGELKKVHRGQLTLKTDDAGFIYIEWDVVTSVISTRQFEVALTDGQRYFGSLIAGDPRSVVVHDALADTSLATADITMITPIGTSFWRRLDGSLDFGFSYTKSSEIAQFTGNSTTIYREPSFEFRLTGSTTLTQNGGDGERDDRGTIQASYLRYRGQRLFLGIGTGFESNESLGLILRSQVASVLGMRLVNSNRAQLSVGGGLAGNDERNIEADPTQNLEALLTLRTSYFTYDRPRTNLDVGFQYYPSLSNWNRQRIQLDAGVKREIWKDVFVAVNMFDTFDSKPPTETADRNDVGVVMSFGWTF